MNLFTERVKASRRAEKDDWSLQSHYTKSQREGDLQQAASPGTRMDTPAKRKVVRDFVWSPREGECLVLPSPCCTSDLALLLLWSIFLLEPVTREGLRLQ